MLLSYNKSEKSKKYVKMRAFFKPNLLILKI